MMHSGSTSLFSNTLNACKASAADEESESGIAPALLAMPAPECA
jgi:hypothetical protein